MEAVAMTLAFLWDPIPTLPTEAECRTAYSQWEQRVCAEEVLLQKLGGWCLRQRVIEAQRQKDLWWAAWWVRWPRANVCERLHWAAEIDRIIGRIDK